MKLIVELKDNEICNKFHLEFIVASTQKNWAYFSCRRRINEVCDEKGWEVLEECIQEARKLWDVCIHQPTIQMDVEYYNRFSLLFPWAANVIYYGITGKKE